MSFDPKDYVGVADHLRQTADAGTCPADAARRAAIGRYYYAALLTARDLLARTSPMPEDRADTTHRWVIQTLRESADSAAQLLTRELNAMRVTRNRAEYGEDMPRLAEDAERMAKSCARALAHVTTLDRRYSG